MKNIVVSNLLGSSAQDARISLDAMLVNSGSAYALDICAAALVSLDADGIAKKSHRKALATVARKAIKQLEQEADQ